MKATDIRDAIANRALAIGRFKRVLKVRSPQIQPDQLPALMVYVSKESMRPYGDHNNGELFFRNVATVCVSIVRAFDTPDNLDDMNNVDIEAFELAVFGDEAFNNFDLFEGIDSIDRLRILHPQGEAYIDELRTEYAFVIKTAMNVDASDPLKKIVVTTRPIGHPAADAIVNQYDF